MPYVHPRYREITGREPDVAALAGPSADAPVDAGERLATLDRPSRSADRPDEQLRISICEYQGHKFLSFKVWTRNARGEWWPAKGKQTSIRLGEVREVSAALLRGLRQVEADASSRPPGRDARRRPTGPNPAGGAGFDEFRDEGYGT